MFPHSFLFSFLWIIFLRVKQDISPTWARLNEAFTIEPKKHHLKYLVTAIQYILSIPNTPVLCTLQIMMMEPNNNDDKADKWLSMIHL